MQNPPPMMSPSPAPKQALVFDKLVWTIEDVACELDCSIRHVYKLIATDRIPYAKVGRLVRFSSVRISEWLKQGGTR